MMRTAEGAVNLRRNKDSVSSIRDGHVLSSSYSVLEHYTGLGEVCVGCP